MKKNEDINSAEGWIAMLLRKLGCKMQFGGTGVNTAITVF
jgi:hypothetical protein